MSSEYMDRVELRACVKIAELALGDNPVDNPVDNSADSGDNPRELTIPVNELPAFIAWCVREFSETLRNYLNEQSGTGIRSG